MVGFLSMTQHTNFKIDSSKYYWMTKSQGNLETETNQPCFNTQSSMEFHDTN